MKISSKRRHPSTWSFKTPLNSMSAVELFLELRKAGVTFSCEGSQLRCEAPHGYLTEVLQEQITAHQKELIKLVYENIDYLEREVVQREQDERLKAQEAQYAAQLRAWDREDRAAAKRRQWISRLLKALGMLVIVAGLWVIGGPWLAGGISIVLLGVVIVVGAFLRD